MINESVKSIQDIQKDVKFHEKMSKERQEKFNNSLSNISKNFIASFIYYRQGKTNKEDQHVQLAYVLQKEMIEEFEKELHENNMTPLALCLYHPLSLTCMKLNLKEEALELTTKIKSYETDYPELVKNIMDDLEDFKHVQIQLKEGGVK
jgi:hypothetical protein